MWTAAAPAKKDFRNLSGQRGYSRLRVPRLRKDGELVMIFDVSVAEILADDGAVPITLTFYPTQPYDRLVTEGSGEVWISSAP